ncbi:MAG: transglycosylase SLT domain-containing protein [Desulfomonile tiedjei]|nr:transglycosylase SLT domain-containing protein [Desulfomonile tiedjei]
MTRVTDFILCRGVLSAGGKVRDAVAGTLFFIFMVVFTFGMSAHPAASMTVATGPMQEHLFKEGKRHFDAGDLDRSRQVWSNIFPDQFFGPICYLLLAGNHLDAGQDVQAEALLREFLKKHPETVYKEPARNALTESLCRQGKPEARSFLATALASASENDKPSLILRLAELERRLGNYPAAAAQYRTLFLKYPASVEGLKAAEGISWMVFHGKVPRIQFSEQEQLARAGGLFAKGRFDLAAEVYQELLKTKPSDRVVMLKLGHCLFKGRRDQQAINTLKDVLRGEISDKDRMEAVRLLSLVFWRLDRSQEFEVCCNTIIEKGSPVMKRKALFNLAAHHLEKHQFDAAWSDFERVLKTNPDRSAKADVKWRMAWIKYFKRDFAKAAEIFKEVRSLSTAAEMSEASNYWEARSLAQANRSKDALPLLKGLADNSPLHYYGIQAAKELKNMGGAPEATKKANHRFPDLTLTSDQKAEKHVAAAEKLMGLGLYDFAVINLGAAPGPMKATPALAFLTARAAYAAEQYRTAYEIVASQFGSVAENPPDGAPADFLELAFPRVYYADAKRLAQKHGVDPHLVWAVIRQESRYDASAVSPAGALGLMQVTPAAAGFTKKAGRLPAKAIEEILEPKRNIDFGIKELSKNLHTFNGKVIPAVASYNADIRKVRQWVQRNRNLKEDEFIENIPYRETRLYVKRVLAGYVAYGHLHRKKDLAGLW